MWKGKADIINHDERLIVDLKTTSDIDKFKYSANQYNYDSQAFIYNQLFNYEIMFIVIDKQTLQIKICNALKNFTKRVNVKYKKQYHNINYFLNQKILTLNNILKQKLYNGINNKNKY